MRSYVVALCLHALHDDLHQHDGQPPYPPATASIPLVASPAASIPGLPGFTKVMGEVEDLSIKGDHQGAIVHGFRHSLWPYRLSKGSLRTDICLSSPLRRAMERWWTIKAAADNGQTCRILAQPDQNQLASGRLSFPYPFGFWLCHRQVSAHISLSPRSARHPNTFRARFGSA
jgi:hypothetical protein